jgi:RNA polymerase sigma factor (sigma-70 family)
VQFPARASRPSVDPNSDADYRLVCELYGSLRRFAAVVAPPTLEPDDLVQEALVRALRLRRLQDLDNAGAYLRRTMLNIASNSRRSSTRQRRAMARLTRGAEPAADTYPSDIRVLCALTPDVRAVLYLAEIEGWTYAEIADLLGCSEVAARTRAVRGRRALRSVLESGDD